MTIFEILSEESVSPSQSVTARQEAAGGADHKPQQKRRLTTDTRFSRHVDPWLTWLLFLLYNTGIIAHNIHTNK